MDTLNTLGGVDFTKYALLTIIQYGLWSNIGEVKNAVNYPPPPPKKKIKNIFN